ncbi:MAG: hypothetical protein JW860_00195 [Sedimentisphaerales bacterium]|nr:hypothetical protein [Sedimentisphaerales bacterium]
MHDAQIEYHIGSLAYIALTFFVPIILSFLRRQESRNANALPGNTSLPKRQPKPTGFKRPLTKIPFSAQKMYKKIQPAFGAGCMVLSDWD